VVESIFKQGESIFKLRGAAGKAGAQQRRALRLGPSGGVGRDGRGEGLEEETPLPCRSKCSREKRKAPSLHICRDPLLPAPLPSPLPFLPSVRASGAQKHRTELTREGAGEARGGRNPEDRVFTLSFPFSASEIIFKTSFLLCLDAKRPAAKPAGLAGAEALHPKWLDQARGPRDAGVVGAQGSCQVPGTRRRSLGLLPHPPPTTPAQLLPSPPSPV